MITERKANLIAEYEQLRHNYDQLEEVAGWMEDRLVELERLLPEDYIFPGDPPQQQGLEISNF